MSRIAPLGLAERVTHKVGSIYRTSEKYRDKFNFFEMDEINLAYPAFVAVICFFVEFPRLLMARDKDERRDILIRDTTTIATILLAKDALKAFAAKIFSKKNGLALVHEAKDKTRNVFKKVIDYLNPRGGVTAYSTDFLRMKYANIHNNKNGVADFAQFVNENGGDIKKLLTSDKKIKETMENIFVAAGKTKEEFNNLDAKGLEIAIKDMNPKSELFKPLYEIMKSDSNPILRNATLINSSFDFSALIAVCAFLGFGLPFLNDKITSARYKNKKSVVDFNSPGFFSARNALQLRERIMQMAFLGKTHTLNEQAPLKNRLKSLMPQR